MTHQTQDIQALLERLERLERAHRRFKGFALVALILATALATIDATQPVPEKITAHRFDVVDGSGKVRVVIDATGSIPPYIALLDAQGGAPRRWDLIH
jgi:hypothetical protein